MCRYRLQFRMTSLRERQLHMTQLLKRLDRMIVEKHGKFDRPFFHYQKPLAPAGERDSVCVYVDAAKREYLPYGPELEKMVEEARLWVRTGEGPKPEGVIGEEAAALESPSSPREKADTARKTAGSAKKLIPTRDETPAKVEKHRSRPSA